VPSANKNKRHKKGDGYAFTVRPQGGSPLIGSNKEEPKVMLVGSKKKPKGDAGWFKKKPKVMLVGSKKKPKGDAGWFKKRTKGDAW
jgi:hypothetical protein